ncbi:NUMOD4 motif-containing HNH endonuclease [Elizabethkingia miricola]|uniref:NUMOD4 motif-containing HNH endonuclease n=1 Tax=Elizabethkingia miricola TaxID=172045 RepID=UPI0020199FB7|nr:NUMOD4 motif-containing HNH endonuclease [Elizabethkingia miricola]MCL1658629.1 NUMOD4 motif-containing HNH endonuclease [Elizabethkingia miricola]
MQEIFKPVKEFSKYEVSNMGNVKNLIKNSILVKQNRGGYLRVWLIQDGVKVMKSVHRLVLEAFIDNPYSKPQVNHINGVKTDNRLVNLEWCTQSENIRHMLRTGLRTVFTKTPESVAKTKEKLNKKVINIKTGEVFESAIYVAEKFNIKRSTLIHYLRGTRTNKTDFRYL